MVSFAFMVLVVGVAHEEMVVKKMKSNFCFPKLKVCATRISTNARMPFTNIREI